MARETVHRFKSIDSHLLRALTGRRLLFDNENWTEQNSRALLSPTRQSERLADAVRRLRLICAALVDIRVSGRWRHDDFREALRDYHRSFYQTVRRVLLNPSPKRFVRTRRQCRTVERRRQRLDPSQILGRDEVA